MKRFLMFIVVYCMVGMYYLYAQPIVHPQIGETVTSDDGAITITLYGKKQNYEADATTRDTDINSPKSINVHPTGKKYYVNSLEGATTIAYDFLTNKKLKVIRHHFSNKDAGLWSKPSGLYEFTHYKDINTNVFYGKPVESTFSHNGKYLWVPYYRRSFDVNAQDPSAVAVINTETDEIVRLMETGPLPKMIATSHDGKYVAISCWGNNTVGLIDISSPNPKDWKHVACIVVDYKLKLDFSLTTPVDRDNGSGYALRGTVFTPDNKYLLVGCMGGGGGIAIIDIRTKTYLGRIMGMMDNVRHLVIKNGFLYLSINVEGYVQRISLNKVLSVIPQFKRKRTINLNGWTSCKVEKGARTIVITPDGKFIFVACNNASRLCVVCTKTMKQIAEIPVDSYPVGLDISKNGKFVFVTSQGRNNQGGNAVNIYKINYK